MKKLIFTLAMALLSGAGIMAADYYWVGGSGNWSDYANHWATSSGGTGFHTQEPTQTDNVFFDANSFTGTGQIVTVSATAFCADMNWTGVSNNPTFQGSGSQNLNIYGSLAFSENMNFAYGIHLYFMATSGSKTISTAGKAIKYSVFDGSGSWTLLDGLNAGGNTISFVKGTLITDDHPITAQSLYLSSGEIRSLSLGASIITLSGSSYSTLYMNCSNLIFNAGTSLIEFSGSNGGMYVYGANLTFYDVLFSSPSGVSEINQYAASQVHTFNSLTFNGNATIYNSNTIGTLTLSPGKKYTIGNGKTQTILNDLVANGNAAAMIYLTSDWGQATLFKESGAVIVDYVSLQGINATGGATFTANNSLDMGNNSGWQINPPPNDDYYWVGETGNWNDPAHWALSSGGAGGIGVPTLLNNVFFDANSFSAAGQTVTLVGDVTNSVNCRNMNWAGATNNPTFTSTSSYSLRIYGSLTLTPNMTYAFNGLIHFKATDSGHTIFTGGKLLNNYIYFEGEGGEWTLMDGLNIGTKRMQFERGTLNTNNQEVFAEQLYSYYSYERTLNLGSSVITLSYSPQSWSSQTLDLRGSNLSLNAGTSLIKFTGANARLNSDNQSGLVYYDVLFDNPDGNTRLDASNGTFNSVVFNGNGSVNYNNTTGTMTFSPGKQYSLGGTINIVNDLIANGTETEFINISGGTISKESGAVTVNWVSLQNSNATGGASFTANNSLDMGNNTGWIINQPPPKSYYWVGGTGNYNDAAHWSLSSGGDGDAGVPTILDNVFFDANSFTAEGQTLTLIGDASYNVNCRDMTWTGVAFNPTLAGAWNQNLHI
ncbi:MAG: hypothetical protein EOM83_15155, partial [Clostridia bacterium]|nr:hypothetical protein [Clostridia bacterium]